jgi:NAD(P)-dependent dehydrogenase (short-subunit alcohol dehydrogenase family)
MVEGLDGLGYRDRTVVVTGCASGMGEATARILGELGARVHAVDIQQPKIPYETFQQTDLADPAQVDAAVAALAEAGPIDHLFNCAGVPHTLGPLACVLINYVGTRQLTDGLLSQLVDGASIATIASDAGMAWQENLPTLLELLAISDPRDARTWCESHPDALRFDGYSFSKEMLIVWAMHSAVPLAEQRGIRTNCIGPCPTNTAFMVPTVAELGEAYFERFPMPLLHRMSTPEEQAWPLVLLNSRLNSVVSGAVLYTDQGFAGGMWTGQIDPSVMVPGN